VLLGASWSWSASSIYVRPIHVRTIAAVPHAAARLVPELYCSSLEQSLRFYLDLLGFEVEFVRPEERFAYIKREGAEVMLEEPVGRTFLTADLEHPYGRGVNFQIQVDDVVRLYSRVRGSDAPVLLELEDRWYRRDERAFGNRQFVVQDPDGYLLRFFQDLGSRAAQ
jgi:catechol 2,3-dioxygenase-like lactoylglutathione lyase family enzyme